jgi:hypothetical protein
MSDFAIYIHTDDGRIHDIDAPPDIKAQDCVKELVEGLQLSVNGSGGLNEWGLLDKDTGKVLDPALSLLQNGVHSGQALCLRHRAQDQGKGKNSCCPGCGAGNISTSSFCRSCGRSLKHSEASVAKLTVHVLTFAGKSRSIEAAGLLSAGQLLTQLTQSPEFSAAGDDGAAWYLVDQETGTALDAERSLEENGVQDGHHLSVRRSATVAQAAPLPEKTAVSPSLQEKSNPWAWLQSDLEF